MKALGCLLGKLQVLRRIEIRHYLIGIGSRKIQLGGGIVGIKLNRCLKVIYSFLIARILEGLNALVKLVTSL